MATAVAGHAQSAKIVDLSSATVLPWLIDCYAHVLGNLKDFSPTKDLRTSSPQGVLWGVHNVQIWLDHGFTALRTFFVVSLRRATPGPSTLSVPEHFRAKFSLTRVM